MRNPNDILATFEKLESTINVEKLRYKKINVWPICRLRLGFDLLYDRKVTPFNRMPGKYLTFGTLTDVPYQTLKFFYYFFCFLFSLPRVRGKNWFFAFSSAVFTDKIDGKMYSRYIDPYYEFFCKYKLEPARITFQTLTESPCAGPAYFHNASVFRFDYLERAYFCLQKIRFYFGGYKSDLRKTREIVREIAFNLPYADRKFLNLYYYNVFEDVNFYKFCFSFIFFLYKPKNLIFQCFYTEMKFGMLSAANKYKINSIDIQHGLIEDFMYIPYSTSGNNLDLLPSFLWCWSRSDVEIIIKSNKLSNRLQPVRLGNLWYKRTMQKQESIPAFFQAQSKVFSKIVLFTLQHQIGYQKIFAEVVSQAPKNWLFMIRIHPLMTELEIRTYEDELSHFQNVDFECNTQLNLFQCYQLSTVHLTHSSTTAIEALNFNLPTILVDQIGYEYYYKLVNKKILGYGDEAHNIIKQICQIERAISVSELSNYLIDIKDEELIDELSSKVLAK